MNPWVTTLSREDFEWKVGLIPYFISSHLRDRTAAEQIADNYVGGWSPLPGFKMTGLAKGKGELLPWPKLHYPGDPPMEAIAGTITVSGERVYVFPYGWVAVVQPDGSFEASRCD